LKKTIKARYLCRFKSGGSDGSCPNFSLHPSIWQILFNFLSKIPL